MATSTPSGDKERNRRAEVNPGVATPGPATLQGTITDDMLAAEPREAAPAPISSKSETALTAKAPVVHFDNVKKERRFHKVVDKVKNRIARGNEGGGKIKGILSVVFGILGLLCWFLLILWALNMGLEFLGLLIILLQLISIAAIVLGFLSLKKGDKSLGIAGLALAFTGLFLFLLMAVSALLS